VQSVDPPAAVDIHRVMGIVGDVMLRSQQQRQAAEAVGRTLRKVGKRLSKSNPTLPRGESAYAHSRSPTKDNGWAESGSSPSARENTAIFVG